MPSLLVILGFNAVGILPALILVLLLLSGVSLLTVAARFAATQYRKFEIRTTCEELRRVGVNPRQIQCYALAAAKRRSQNPLTEILRLLLQLFRRG